MDPLINENGLPLVSSEQVISDITYDDDGTDIGSTINTGWLDCVGEGGTPYTRWVQMCRGRNSGIGRATNFGKKRIPKSRAAIDIIH